MQKPMVLNLDSEAFNAFKSDFNMILRNTIATMQQKEVEDASITVKFDISLLQQANPNVMLPTVLAKGTLHLRHLSTRLRQA